MISKTPPTLALCALMAVLLGAASASVHAAGFAFENQGGKAAGMAGAFVAQASDPSAIFYNPGGLALMEKKKAVSAGTSLLAFNESLYQGLPPGIGTSTTGEQETPMDIPPHAYITLPVGARMVAGMGVYSPFRMNTEWADAGSFAGRYLATKSSIEAYDLAPTLGIQLSPSLGLGIGAVYRSSEVSVARRLPGQAPSGEGIVDIASLDMKTDMEPGYGFTAGLLYKGKRLSIGASYRSAIETDYVGVGRLTQIETGDAQYDQLIRASLPFDQDLLLTSSLEYPDQASFGVAWSLSKAILLEVDVNRTGWGSVQDLALRFSSASTLDTSYRLDFEDAMSYRLGARYRLPTGPQLRVGYAFDETPQPDTSVGAFLPDSDRSTVSVGFGLDWLDVAFSWVTYDQRIVFTSLQDLNGNYRANGWMFTISATK
ncbi:MAG TPA: outer membrane protein transport protein [Thermoanaerobaculia bacterium]|nr:outer membrane protein transport protein [Thermoanaerobaculia bacterium]